MAGVVIRTPFGIISFPDSRTVEYLVYQHGRLRAIKLGAYLSDEDRYFPSLEDSTTPQRIEGRVITIACFADSQAGREEARVCLEKIEQATMHGGFVDATKFGNSALWGDYSIPIWPSDS